MGDSLGDPGLAEGQCAFPRASVLSSCAVDIRCCETEEGNRFGEKKKEGKNHNDTKPIFIHASGLRRAGGIRGVFAAGDI
jgi:hypothetical protein